MFLGELLMLVPHVEAKDALRASHVQAKDAALHAQVLAVPLHAPSAEVLVAPFISARSATVTANA